MGPGEHQTLWVGGSAKKWGRFLDTLQKSRTYPATNQSTAEFLIVPTLACWPHRCWGSGCRTRADISAPVQAGHFQVSPIPVPAAFRVADPEVPKSGRPVG
eukprot:s878_g2.t1